MNDIVKIWLSCDEDEIRVFDTRSHHYWHPNDLIGRRIVSISFEALEAIKLELEEFLTAV